MSLLEKTKAAIFGKKESAEVEQVEEVEADEVEATEETVEAEETESEEVEEEATEQDQEGGPFFQGDDIEGVQAQLDAANKTIASLTEKFADMEASVSLMIEQVAEQKAHKKAVAMTAAQGVPVADVPAAVEAVGEDKPETMADLIALLNAESDPLAKAKIYDKYINSLKAGR